MCMVLIPAFLHSPAIPILYATLLFHFIMSIYHHHPDRFIHSYDFVFRSTLLRSQRKGTSDRRSTKRRRRPGTPNRMKKTQANFVGNQNNKCRMQTEPTRKEGRKEGKPNRSKRTRSIETSHQKHRVVRNSLVAVNIVRSD